MAKKLAYGVGLYEAGEYVSWDGGKATKEYTLWKSMLRRCYSDDEHKHWRTYIGCSVSDEFKDFQRFAAWANLQVGYGLEGYQLDKDLMMRGNKVYSNEACVFIPREVNMLLISSGASRGAYPVGVCKHRGKYQATCKVGTGTNTYLGTFPTPEAAFDAYKTAKEAFIKQRADEYRDQIDPRAYAALMAYEVLITD